MHISAEGKIGLALGLVALAGGGAIVIWPEHTEIGWAMMGLAAMGGVMLAIHHFGEQWRPIVRRAVYCGFFAAVVAGLLGWYFWPDRSYPGIGVYTYIRVYDTPQYLKRHVFEFETPASAKASFYLSASDQFTFSVTDVHGSIYPIEIKVGQGGIPIDRFVSLFCEFGLREDTSFLRVSVDNRVITYRVLPTRIDLGTVKWGAGKLGATVIGNVAGVFELLEIGVWPKTFTATDRRKLHQNVTEIFTTTTGRQCPASSSGAICGR